MGAFPSPIARTLPWRAVLTLALSVGLAGLVGPADPVEAGPTLDRPVIWYEDDRQPVPMVADRNPHPLETGVKDGVFRPLYRFLYPGHWLRKLSVPFGGDHVMPAANLNSLDEVPNSTWFTNRIGLYPLTAAECADGPGGDGPDRSRPWRIIGAKIGGVTPGFRIRDARGDIYLIKFDPPGYVGMTLGAGVITNRILWAAGYNVPEDEAITFSLDDMVIEPGVSLHLSGAGDLPLTPARLDSILTVLQPGTAGTWRALSSKFLAGKPVGFFDYQGRRRDDPNDRIRHEHRRELRGLRMFAAWLKHFDSKQENTLDVFVEIAPGRGHVRHYLIDFASTIGAAGWGPDRKWGYEYTVDPEAILGNLLSLGLHESTWRQLELPADMPEVGYWDVVSFDPMGFKPILANSAFAHMTDRDGYWAAKIISAFNDEQLGAIVAEARYAQPAAAAYITRTLAGRRDKIARYFFDRIAPLDFFLVRGQHLAFTDLGLERGIYPVESTRYQYRWAPSTVTREMGPWTAWQEAKNTLIPLAEGAATEAKNLLSPASHPYLAVEVRVDRGRGWQGPVRVYLEQSTGRVAALER